MSRRSFICKILKLILVSTVCKRTQWYANWKYYILYFKNPWCDHSKMKQDAVGRSESQAVKHSFNCWKEQRMCMNSIDANESCRLKPNKAGSSQIGSDLTAPNNNKTSEFWNHSVKKVSSKPDTGVLLHQGQMKIWRTSICHLLSFIKVWQLFCVASKFTNMQKVMCHLTVKRSLMWKYMRILYISIYPSVYKVLYFHSSWCFLPHPPFHRFLLGSIGSLKLYNVCSVKNFLVGL